MRMSQYQKGCIAGKASAIAWLISFSPKEDIAMNMWEESGYTLEDCETAGCDEWTISAIHGALGRQAPSQTDRAEGEIDG